jgi:hypothetical protein
LAALEWLDRDIESALYKGVMRTLGAASKGAAVVRETNLSVGEVGAKGDSDAARRWVAMTSLGGASSIRAR